MLNKELEAQFRNHLREKYKMFTTQQLDEIQRQIKEAKERERKEFSSSGGRGRAKKYSYNELSEMTRKGLEKKRAVDNKNKVSR